MNANTSAAFQNLPSQVVSISTIQGFLNTGGASPALAANALLVLQPPPDLVSLGVFDARPFRVRLAGKYVSAAGTATVAIYQGNAAAQLVAANLLVSAAGTAAVSSNFWLEAELIWDSVSQRLNGTIQGSVDKVFVTPAILAATGNQITGVTNQNLLQFMAAVTFSSANAGNSVQLSEFSVERV